MCSKLLSMPRIECGTMPSRPSGIGARSVRSSAVRHDAYAGARTPCSCCSRATSSSTASAPAMLATPGRVTVHCWSSVRSLSDWVGRDKCGDAIRLHMLKSMKFRQVPCGFSTGGFIIRPNKQYPHFVVNQVVLLLLKTQIVFNLFWYFVLEKNSFSTLECILVNNFVCI